MCLSEMDTNNNNVHVTTNHVVPVVSIYVLTPVSHGEKPEKFNGNNFKRWQQKCYSISLR